MTACGERKFENSRDKTGGKRVRRPPALSAARVSPFLFRLFHPFVSFSVPLASCNSWGRRASSSN